MFGEMSQRGRTPGTISDYPCLIQQHRTASTMGSERPNTHFWPQELSSHVGWTYMQYNTRTRKDNKYWLSAYG